MMLFVAVHFFVSGSQTPGSTGISARNYWWGRSMICYEANEGREHFARRGRFKKWNEMIMRKT